MIAPHARRGGVAHQKAVVEHPVGHVDQHVEVRVRGQLPGVPPPLEQCAQRGPAGGGEVREHARAGFVSGTVLECTGGSNLTAAALTT